MKKWGSSISIILLLCLVAGCSPGRPEQKQAAVRIAVNTWAGYAYIFIAQEKGFFKGHGVDVELVLKERYADSQNLYEERRVDGFCGVYSDVILYTAEGLTTTAVWLFDRSDAGDVLVARPEFRSVADLKGKKVGIGGFNTFSHLFTLSLLEKMGPLREEDVRFTVVPEQQVVEALDRGTIDAAHTWEPAISLAEAKGYRVIAKAGDVPGLITDVLAFNSIFMQEHTREIEAVVSALAESFDYVQAHRAEAVEIMARNEHMSAGEMERGLRGVHLFTLDEIAAYSDEAGTGSTLYTTGDMIVHFYLERGQLSTVPDLKSTIDPRYVRQLWDKKKSSR